MPSYATVGGAVFAVSAGATLAVRALARRRGWMVAPRADRWHREPTALFGGLGVLAGLVAGLLAFTPMTWPLPGLLALTCGMAAVGLADDTRELRPQSKLVAQIAAGLLLYLLDFHFNAAWPWLLDLAVVVFWVVAITNAMNLLDNMNGLCAGVAIIAAGFRFLFYAGDGNAAGAMLAVIFAAAVGGFFVFNFPRASIFLGDTGSFVVGFFLAAINLTSGEAYSRGLFSVLAFPVLVLALPIFDTAFVSVVRWLSGRAVSQGGRDHSSHRLVAVGLSETNAVLLLHGISIASGSVAFAVYRGQLSWGWLAGGLLVIGLLLFGIFLAGVSVYPERDAPAEAAVRSKPAILLQVEVPFKRLVLWVVVDTLTILVAWYAAFLVRYADVVPFDPALARFADSAPVALLMLLVAFYAQGLYRADWQHFSLTEIRIVSLGAALGLLATVLVQWFRGRPDVLPWSLLVVAYGALVLMLSGTRVFVRSLADVMRPSGAGTTRVLIYGAGAGGELALRELRSNSVLGQLPVGFLDDNPLRHGASIHGLRVLGGLDDLESLLGQHGVEGVMVSTSTLTDTRRTQLSAIAERHGVRISRIRVTVAPMDTKLD